ncbi:MAG: DUF6457 domain-containing protein [Actinomycetota bacterium]
MDWLQQMTNSLAKRIGQNGDAFAISDEDRTVILDLARIASHASGDRRNAPLLCYVIGLLAGKGLSLSDAEAVVGEVSA